MGTKKRMSLLICGTVVGVGIAAFGTVKASVAGEATGGAASRLSVSALPSPPKGYTMTVGVPEKDNGVVAKAEPFDPRGQDGLASGATAAQ